MSVHQMAPTWPSQICLKNPRGERLPKRNFQVLKHRFIKLDTAGSSSVLRYSWGVMVQRTRTPGTVAQVKIERWMLEVHEIFGCPISDSCFRNIKVAIWKKTHFHQTSVQKWHNVPNQIHLKLQKFYKEKVFVNNCEWYVFIKMMQPQGLGSFCFL